MIETGDASRHSGDRSRAVFAVVCELVPRGWQSEKIEPILLDPSLGISAHCREQDKPAQYAQRQVERARDILEGDYRRTKEDVIVSNDQGNIRRALSEIHVEVSHDTFADRLLITGPDGAPPRQLTDAEMTTLWLAVDHRCGFRPRKDFFFDVVADTARGNSFHPCAIILPGCTGTVCHGLAAG